MRCWPTCEQLNAIFRAGIQPVCISARVLLERRGDEGFVALLDALADAKSGVRVDAAKAIGNAKSPRSIAPLVVTLADREPIVRMAAANALTALGWTATTPGERAALAVARGQFAEAAAEGEAAVAPLVLAGAGGDNRDATAALISVGSRAVDPLLAMLTTGSQRQGEVARLLGELGDPRAIPGLAEALDGADRFRRIPIIEALFALRWHPEPARRAAIVKSSWETGLALGFAEAIHPALAALFERSGGRNEKEIRRGLERTQGRSLLTPDLAALAVDASSFDHKFHGYKYDAGYLTKDRSNAAIAVLVATKTPLSSNILYFVKDKRSTTVRMGTGCSPDWDEPLDFQEQRMAAVRELERRGNPRYDPSLFLGAAL
jgi:hypothetical protein